MQPKPDQTNAKITAALSLIDEWLQPQGPAGVGAAVWHAGGLVAERYVGEARPGVAVDPRTIFGLASVTKPVTAATVMTLVENGRLSLDEPVARLLPEFRSATAATPSDDAPDLELERLRPSISARQLLSHTAGLPEDIGPRDSRYADQTSLSDMVDLMCRIPLRSAPGAEFRYSNVGYGVLTRLVERVADQEFWQATRERVLDPLGLADTVARPAPQLADRIAHLADAAAPGTAWESYNSPYWRDLAIPWGGLYGTPRDLVRFAAAFLPSGPRLLSPAATAAMTNDQTGGVPGGVESAKVHWDIARWGLGWEVKGEKRRHWTGDLPSPATFCHFGQAGTLLWADPQHDLALAVFATRSVARMWAFIVARWARLSNAVVAAVP